MAQALDNVPCLNFGFNFSSGFLYEICHDFCLYLPDRERVEDSFAIQQERSFICPILALPDELIIEISHYLTSFDIGRLSHASRHFKRVLREHFWKEYYLDHDISLNYPEPFITTLFVAHYYRIGRERSIKKAASLGNRAAKRDLEMIENETKKENAYLPSFLSWEELNIPGLPPSSYRRENIC